MQQQGRFLTGKQRSVGQAMASCSNIGFNQQGRTVPSQTRKGVGRAGTRLDRPR